MELLNLITNNKFETCQSNYAFMFMDLELVVVITIYCTLRMVNKDEHGQILKIKIKPN